MKLTRREVAMQELNRSIDKSIDRWIEIQIDREMKSLQCSQTILLKMSIPACKHYATYFSDLSKTQLSAEKPLNETAPRTPTIRSKANLVFPAPVAANGWSCLALASPSLPSKLSMLTTCYEAPAGKNKWMGKTDEMRASVQWPRGGRRL